MHARRGSVSRYLTLLAYSNVNRGKSRKRRKDAGSFSSSLPPPNRPRVIRVYLLLFCVSTIETCLRILLMHRGRRQHNCIYLSVYVYVFLFTHTYVRKISMIDNSWCERVSERINHPVPTKSKEDELFDACSIHNST